MRDEKEKEIRRGISWESEGDKKREREIRRDRQIRRDTQIKMERQTDETKTYR